MTITVLVLITDYMIISDIYNYLPLPTLFPLCLQQTPQLAMVLQS